MITLNLQSFASVRRAFGPRYSLKISLDVVLKVFTRVSHLRVSRKIKMEKKIKEKIKIYIDKFFRGGI